MAICIGVTKSNRLADTSAPFAISKAHVVVISASKAANKGPVPCESCLLTSHPWGTSNEISGWSWTERLGSKGTNRVDEVFRHIDTFFPDREEQRCGPTRIGNVHRRSSLVKSFHTLQVSLCERTMNEGKTKQLKGIVPCAA